MPEAPRIEREEIAVVRAKEPYARCYTTVTLVYQRSMLTQPTAKLVCESISRDVVILSWPDQAHELERLERNGTPRLWLVEPGVDPPISDTCLEDWLRLPVEDTDVRARLISLTHRAAHHPTPPTLDEHGQLTQNGSVVLLSPVEQHLAEPLIANFGEAVSEGDLMSSAWHEGGSEQTLRVHMSRLRRRLVPLGLTITSIRAYGYVMRVDL
jgi:two-component system OmpR family response regulator